MHFTHDVSVSSVVSLFICVSIQLASGAFGHIKDTVLSALNREPTMDISPETVGTLSLIMLAQAQEVFFLKATSGIQKTKHIETKTLKNCYWDSQSFSAEHHYDLSLSVM